MNPDVDYLLAFLTGLFGSLHCVGMCGGLVSAFFLKIGNRGGIFPYINYHAGRIMVYTILGAAVASVGAAVGRTSAFGRVQAMIMLVAGLVVILIGFDMLRILPWRLPIEKVPVKPLRKLYRSATDKGPLVGSFLGGVLNGLIPCSLLYAMLISSATVGSAADGGLLLAAFGAGTLPAMFSVGFVLGQIGARARGMLLKVAAFVIIFMGAKTLVLAFSMLFQTVDNGACH